MTPPTPTDRRSTTVTRAHFKRPVWTWFCDRCGKTSGDLATDQKDLPTPERMRRRGWFIAETWGDRCPECVEAAPLPLAAS